MEIVAVGEPEFSLGFELAGVKSVSTSTNEAEKTITALMAEPGIGILIVGQRTFDALSAEARERLLKALRPVAVILSEKDENEELRSMIIKAIGVDLWKAEDE